MTPERWQRVKDILEQTEIQPPARKRDWLREVCGEDTDLLREVESLLSFEDELDGFIEEPVVAAVSRAMEKQDELAALKKVGPYRLLRLLGRGGMGSVYLAARQEDFEKQVALKILSPGLATRESIQRFEAERQILARLEHPNIARLLDGGTSADGLPYFAMEVVEGLPIDLYCDEQGLGVRERLRLFLDICSALQMAHQSLVIHRDLKPGNILVDHAGVPKLLDFGIAKLLHADGAAPTRTAQAFTLYYASPEQLQGEPVGTASDVYSLGVVLYEVLTGRLPGRLEGRSHFDMMRAICEDEAAAASQAVEAPPSPKLGELKAWRRQLAGDVDAILARALRKEPAQRYASVQDLAEDIRRYLDHRPVLARQGNLSYRLGKFLRRHRLAVASVAAVVLLALAFTKALVNKQHETEIAKERAEGVSSFLIGLFQAAAPDQPAGPEPTVRQLLARGRQNLEAGLEQDPETRATLQLKLGEVYYKLGDYAEAEALFEGAKGFWGQRPGEDLASALSGLAGVYFARGEVGRAEVMLRECIALRRRLGLEKDLLKPLSSLATILFNRGELKEAEQIYRECLERRRATLGSRHENVATSLRSLARVLDAAGRTSEAEAMLLEALSIREEVFGSESTKVAAVLTSLAEVNQKLGHLAEAQTQLEKALGIYRVKLGENHLDTARAEKDLAELEQRLGENERACDLARRALATFRSIKSVADAEIALAEALLAGCAKV